MYKELGGRELLMRRKIEDGGATTWEPAPLVEGAWEGRLVHLAGLDVIGSTAGSLARLTRDTTNSPAWNTGNPRAAAFEEEGTAGRVGRFARKFEELGSELDDAQWMEEMAGGVKAEVVHKPKPKPSKPRWSKK